MNLLLQILILVIGLVLLVKGADWLVDGASGIAKFFGVSPMFVGLTIVAFGTSAPELAVSVSASMKGSAAIAISNIIGSNIANTALVIGLTSMIMPLAVQKNTIRKELPFNILISIVLFSMLMRDGLFRLDRFDGIVLLVFLVIFLEYTFIMAKNDRSISVSLEKEKKSSDKDKKKMMKNIFFTLVGLAMVVFGADLTVNSATKIALSLGISEALVGLSMVAIGTSLPELVTSISAAMKKEIDIAVGNIVGSNIFNILLILGFSSTLNPIQVNVSTYWIDLTYLLALSVMLWVFSITKRKIERWEGMVFFASYIFYIVFIAFRG